MARSMDVQRSSTFCGTPLFMASGQILCRRADARTDVYGLGVTLYLAFTGRAPAPGLSPAPDAVLLRCLAKDPAERFATAAEAAGALREAAAADAPP